MQAVDAQPWDPGVKALTQFPVGARQPGAESQLDLCVRRGVSHPSRRRYVGCSGVARESVGCRQPEIRIAAHGGATVAASHRDSICESTGRVCSHVQPCGGLWLPVCNSRIQRRDRAATAVVAFGVGIAVGAMMSGGYCGWGYSSWNCGWHGTTTVVYRGGAYYGNAAWHGGYYGSSASRVWTIRQRASSMAITHPQGLMLVAAQPPTPTAAKAPVKHTTRGPGLMPRPCKGPMLMEAMGPRRLRKMVTLRTASIKRPRREQPVGANLERWLRLRRFGQVQQRVPLVRPQMATSMRPRTATSTRTPEAAGEQKGGNWNNVQKPSSSVPGSCSGLGRAGKKRRIVGLRRWRRRLGNPGRRVLVARRAWAVVVAGAAARRWFGDESESSSRAQTQLGMLVKCLTFDFWRMIMSLEIGRIAISN